MKIVKCPRCGKKGELRQYTNGDKNIIHDYKRTWVNGLGIFNEVTNNCYIPGVTHE